MTLSKGKVSLKRRIWKFRWFYVLMLPALIYFIVYRYIPMWGALMAFQDFSPVRGIWGSDWVGLRHFRFFFSHENFFTLLRNTLTISIGSLVFAYPIPIILSLMLNEVRHKWFKRGVQSLIYLPNFLSGVVVWSLAFILLSTNDGLINHWIAALGGNRINFLMNEATYYPLFIGVEIWQRAGFGTIIFLAALAGVDVQLYESAMVEGAGRWKQMWHITLPSLMPVIMVMLILQMGQLLDVSLERTILFSNAMNRPVAEVFDSHIFNRGIMGGDFSYSAAVGLWRSVVGMVLVLGANRISKFFTDDAIY